VPPPRDPRFRRYRASLWILYFGAIALGVTILVGSVARHLRAPRRVAASGVPTRAALRVCVNDLEALFDEQNRRALGLAADLEHKAPFEAWNAWAREWEARVADLSDRCALDDVRGVDAAARSEMAAARDAILALHRAYAAHVNRFAAEEGDLVRGAAEALAHARAAVVSTR
jgi:hypothetical protein